MNATSHPKYRVVKQGTYYAIQWRKGEEEWTYYNPLSYSKAQLPLLLDWKHELEAREAMKVAPVEVIEDSMEGGAG